MADKVKEAMLHNIIAIEMDFFTSMNTEEKVPPNTLPALQRMRWMTYVVLSPKTIGLLLRDWEEAKKAGRNTMIEKYALLDNLIEPIQENPIIDKIATQEKIWIDALAEDYPEALQGHDDNKGLFKRYMLCELQTWSPDTLESYWEDVQRAVKEKRNMAEERYDALYASLGKGSLKEVCQAAKHKK